MKPGYSDQYERSAERVIERVRARAFEAWGFRPSFKKLDGRTRAYWRHFMARLEESGKSVEDYVDWLSKNCAIRSSAPTGHLFNANADELLTFIQEQTRVVDEKEATAQRILEGFYSRWPGLRKKAGMRVRCEEVVHERLAAGWSEAEMLGLVAAWPAGSEEPMPWLVFRRKRASDDPMGYLKNAAKAATLEDAVAKLRQVGPERYLRNTGFMVILSEERSFARVWEATYGKKFREEDLDPGALDAYREKLRQEIDAAQGFRPEERAKVMARVG